MIDNIQVLLIDGQHDFCSSEGSLFVPGAEEDMENFVKMIERIGSKISNISATMDSHRPIDVAHPVMWVNSQSENPAPFTIITKEDVADGVWRAANPVYQARLTEYVNQLATNGKFPLCIWPYHCIIGEKGHQLYEPVAQVLREWQLKKFKLVNYVTKGSNPFTEHYSAVQADVPDPKDPTTHLNTELLKMLENSTVLIAGEALSHCVKNSVIDILEEFGAEQFKNFILLEDCMSSVPGFEKDGEDFLNEMRAKGVQVMKSTDILK